MTKDPFFLQSVVGYQIEWVHQPWQVKVPKQFHMNEKQRLVTQKEIANMLEKGAIKQVEDGPNQFISTIFVVPKNTGVFDPFST